MSDADLAHRLAMMQKQFDEAPTDPQTGPDDGEYQTLIQSFDFFEGKKDPDAYYFKIVASIVHDADWGGHELSRLHNLFPKEDVERRLGWLKQDLAALGVNMDGFDLSELQPESETLNALLDKPVLMRVYTNKKGYKNVVIERRLDDGDFGTVGEQVASFDNGSSPEPESTDDIPFLWDGTREFDDTKTHATRPSR